MTTITIANENLIITIQGLDVIWALRRQFIIPIAHITECVPAVDEAKAWLLGIKIGGTHIPGLISAGTFVSSYGLTFWDVCHAKNAIALSLVHERYTRIVIEVENPDTAIADIQEQMKHFS